MLKLGKRIVMIIVIYIMTAVFLVVCFNVYRARNTLNNSLSRETIVGLTVLKTIIWNDTNETTTLNDLMTTNEDFLDAIENKNTTFLDEEFARLDSTGEISAVFLTADKSTLWSSTGSTITTDLVSDFIGTSQADYLVDDYRGMLYYATSTVVKNADNNILGTFISLIDLSSATCVDASKEETDAEFTIFLGDTRMATTVTENGKRMTGTTMSDSVKQEVITNANTYSGRTKIGGQSYYCYYQPLTNNSNQVIGALFCGMSTAEADSDELTDFILSLCLGAFMCVMCGIFFIFFVKLNIRIPLVKANNLAEAMKEGNLEYPDCTEKLKNNEITDLLHRLETTKHSLAEYVSDISRMLSEMGSGDFTTSAMDYKGSFSEINRSMELIQKQLSETIHNLYESANEVTMGTEQISNGAQLLSNGNITQAAAVEELASTVKEIADDAQANADSAKQASDYASEMSNKISLQVNDMKQLQEAMLDIIEKTKNIESINQTIDDIAFQTNILALNAAVEAARAGEAGKGFSVVADEVRNLASKSAESVQHTAAIIKETVTAVEKGNKIVNTTEESLKNVVNLTKTTTELIGDISISSDKQATATNQVNQGLNQISEVIQQNSATAEESAASCEELNGQANMLLNQVGRFKVN